MKGMLMDMVRVAADMTIMVKKGPLSLIQVIANRPGPSS